MPFALSNVGLLLLSALLGFCPYGNFPILAGVPFPHSADWSGKAWEADEKEPTNRGKWHEF